MLRLQPRVLLFMDNNGGAKQAADLLPNCRVISRIFKAGQPNETDLHRYNGATRAWVQARAADHDFDQRLYINSACEPSKDREDDVRRLVSETLLALEWALPRGIKVAAPHGAFYGIRNWRELDPLANFIAEHPNQFLLTCDEYGAGHFFSGVVDPRLAGGNEVGHIDPATWRASPIPHYWHIGSITGYMRDRKARGLPVPMFAITEGLATDALSDVTTFRNTLKLASGYDDARGWKSIIPQWEAWWNNPASPFNRGWSPDDAYAEQIEAVLREIYAPFPEFVGAIIYCWGWVDPQWQQFDVSHATWLQARLESMQIGVPPVANVPKPTTAPIHARLKTLPSGATYRNIRGTLNDSGQAGADVGNLIIGDEVFYVPATAATFNYHYIRQVKTGVEGWVLAAPSVTFELIVDTPDSAELAALREQVAILTAEKVGLQATNATLSALNTSLQAEKAALMAHRDDLILRLSAIKGLAMDIHEKAGHLYNTVDGGLESVDKVEAT